MVIGAIDHVTSIDSGARPNDLAAKSPPKPKPTITTRCRVALIRGIVPSRVRSGRIENDEAIVVPRCKSDPIPRSLPRRPWSKQCAANAVVLASSYRQGCTVMSYYYYLKVTHVPSSLWRNGTLRQRQANRFYITNDRFGLRPKSALSWHSPASREGRKLFCRHPLSLSPQSLQHRFNRAAGKPACSI